MIINGKHIQQDIVEMLKARIQAKSYTLDIIYVGENVVIEKYINAKKKLGEALGVKVSVHRFPEDTTDVIVKEKINEISLSTDGILIQLPLPGHIDRQDLLEYVDPSLDVDILTQQAYGRCMEGKNDRLPPVVRACTYVLDTHGITLDDKKICILGNGKLVGKPMADWCQKKGIVYTQLTKEDFSRELLLDADVVISGMGAPHLVTSDMVKAGVVILDAGTSEEKGSVVGDIHPDVAEKASFFTPVPGGIGPLTVVALFHNLIEPYER